MSVTLFAVLIGALIITSVLAVVAIVGDRRRQQENVELLQIVQSYARAELGLLGHLRRTMEDLRDRDPVIAETVELGLAELAVREPQIAAMARGDYATLRQLVEGDPAGGAR